MKQEGPREHEEASDLVEMQMNGLRQGTSSDLSVVVDSNLHAHVRSRLCHTLSFKAKPAASADGNEHDMEFFESEIWMRTSSR